MNVKVLPLPVVAVMAACLIGVGGVTAWAGTSEPETSDHTLCIGGPGKQVSAPDKDGTCKKDSTLTVLMTRGDLDLAIADERRLIAQVAQESTGRIAALRDAVSSELQAVQAKNASQLQEVQAQVAALKASLADLQAGNAKLTARISQLEAQLSKVSSEGAE